MDEDTRSGSERACRDSMLSRFDSGGLTPNMFLRQSVALLLTPLTKLDSSATIGESLPVGKLEDMVRCISAHVLLVSCTLGVDTPTGGVTTEAGRLSSKWRDGEEGKSAKGMPDVDVAATAEGPSGDCASKEWRVDSDRSAADGRDGEAVTGAGLPETGHESNEAKLG